MCLVSSRYRRRKGFPEGFVDTDFPSRSTSFFPAAPHPVLFLLVRRGARVLSIEMCSISLYTVLCIVLCPDAGSRYFAVDRRTLVFVCPNLGPGRTLKGKPSPSNPRALAQTNVSRVDVDPPVLVRRRGLGPVYVVFVGVWTQEVFGTDRVTVRPQCRRLLPCPRWTLAGRRRPDRLGRLLTTGLTLLGDFESGTGSGRTPSCYLRSMKRSVYLCD